MTKQDLSQEARMVKHKNQLNKRKKKKNLRANAGDIRDAAVVPRFRKSLKRGMTSPSSILTWEIPWIEEPGGLQSIGLQRVGHN